MKKILLLLMALSLTLCTACTDNKQDDNNSVEASTQISETTDGESTDSLQSKEDESFESSSVIERESSEYEDYSEDTDPNESVEDDSHVTSESEIVDSSSNISESEVYEDSSAIIESEVVDVSSVISESEVVDSSTVESESESETESSSADESSVVVSPSEPNGAVFVSNGILISGTRGMEQYYGSEASGTKYSEYVAAFKQDLGSDVEVYSIVVPHASCYYAPSSYSNLITRGQVNFSNLKSKAGSSVNYVDVYSTLASHTDEDIYPRTEHHWNALGAYYAAEEFAKIAGVDFSPLSSFEKITKPGFVGTLYAFSKSSVLLNNPEDFVIYMPTQEYTAYFCNEGNYNFDNYNYSRSSVVFDVKSYAGAFLGGDSVWVKIVTGNSSGRKLVIFKDSYGNAFVPFTLGSFDEVYVLDIRNYNRNGVDFCQNVGATDVAFVVSGFTATGTVYKNIEKIRTAP